MRRWFVRSGSWSFPVVVFLFSATFALGQTGVVTGRVLDAARGDFVEGAEVSVEGTTLKTTTARGGAFTISRVPSGDQTVVVEYLGSGAVSQSVEVTAGQTVTVEVALNSDVVQLEQFVVTGQPEGVSQALALQRVSVQSKLVAASDQFGEISEGNVGEYLKFLPGVSIDYNVNDARGVSLRGLSTAFTIVAVDGTPMAGSSSIDDTRRFEFEQIAMNNVETTELFKTVTPDIPATATGGFVNFVTKSAFDHDDVQRITYNISFGAPSTQWTLGSKGGLWGHGKQRPLRPSLEANYARKLGDKVGFNINYRYSDKYDDAPRILADWNTSGAGALANPQMNRYRVFDEQKLTHREALAAKIDFRPGENTKIFFTGQGNKYDLLFTQRGLDFRLGTSPTMNGDSVTSGTSGTRRVDNTQLQRRKSGETWHFNGTLEQTFRNGSVLTLTPYWSRADGHYDDIQDGFISTLQSFNFASSSATFNQVQLDGFMDLSRTATVTLRNSTGGTVPVDFLRDLGNYTFSNSATGGNFRSRGWNATDKKTGIYGSYVFSLPNESTPVKFNVGFSLDDVTRDISRPDQRGPVAAITGDALRALADDDYTHDIAFGFGPAQFVDPYKVWQAYENGLTRTTANDVRRFEESNNAAYVRADVEVSSDLLLVGGLRWEDRDTNAAASVIANGQEEIGDANVSYSKLFPSLSFKYTPDRQVVVRGGVSRTVGPPDYVDMLPLVRLESTPGSDNATITIPDPDLEPYYTTNLDLSVDYYLKNTGVLGLALYHKTVSNFISPRGMTTQELSDAVTSRGYDPADFSSGSITVNGGSATLQGFEISYAQKLSMLPKPFDGLNLQANFSYVDISSNDLDTYYSAARAVSPKSFNFIVGYRTGRFSTTLTTNWVDDSLYGGFVNTSFFTGSANADPTLDTRLLRYKQARAQTDIKFEWAFRREVSAYLQIRNIFNSGREEYFRGYTKENANIRLPMRYGEFGEPYVAIGFRGSF